ncbi:MAG: hypothetical protein ACR2PL_12105, partial [Dehalococcoidia bacterium]
MLVVWAGDAASLAQLSLAPLPLREQVTLRPLSAAGLHVCLRSLLHWEPPAPFVDWLWEQTEGLPSHVQKGIGYLIDRGVLVRENGTWAFSRPFAEVPLRAHIDPQAVRTHQGLPALLSPCLGRVDEIRQIKDLLKAHRLVTLCGPGGIGKTRLALQVAAQLQERYTNGAVFVPLASVPTAAMVMPA